MAGREGSEAEDGGEEETEKRAEEEGLVPERETRGWSFKSKGEGAVPVRRQCFGWFREKGKNGWDKEAGGRGQRLLVLDSAAPPLFFLCLFLLLFFIGFSGNGLLLGFPPFRIYFF